MTETIIEPKENEQVESFRVIAKAAPNTKHQWVILRVHPTDDNTVDFTAGQIGMNRIMALTPQPIGAHFSVVWNGDRDRPKLIFDGQPEGGADVLIECWGT